MFGSFGALELVIVLVILLLIFGPSRLGEIGSSLGKGIKGFRRSLKDDEIDTASARKEKASDTEVEVFQLLKDPTINNLNNTYQLFGFFS